MGSIYRRRRKDKQGRVRESKVWWVKYFRNGKPFRESSNSIRRADAERLLRDREGRIARGLPVNPRADKIKFDELCQDVVNDYRCNENRSLPDLERRLRKHVLDYFSGSVAAAITPAHVQRYVVHRRDQGAANATINRELAIIRRAFSLGMQNGRILRRPKFSLLRERNARCGFFEDHQIEAVLRNLDDDLRPMIRFAHLTGWRIQSEIQPLTWAQVSFEDGTVRLNPHATKNDEARTFPLTGELRELLEGQRVRTEVAQRKQGRVIPWVFHRNGNPVRNFRGAWRGACKRAGCPGRIPHDLRRTAVRNLVRAGVPERVAMTLTGHRTRAIFERYNIVSEGDLRIAVERLEAARRSPALQSSSKP
jgi:integrase